MESVRGSLHIEVIVDCPNCDNSLINIINPNETSGIDHNEDGHILSQACPNGCWSTEHETFEVEGIICQECKNEFKVEGLDW